jgi:hypothetical protein
MIKSRMFNRFFGRRKVDADRLRMPAVDQPPDIEEVFAKARRQSVNQVIIVTPGRMLMSQPCPAPGSMTPDKVASVEQMMPSKVKRHVAVIACTELGGLTKDASKAIPFLGLLLGLAYIGHAVWVFEGHPSALAAGCRDADVLIVDSAMVPELQQDWVTVASGAMRHPEVYVHDRATYSLRKI